jgi:hypothetical protein
MFIFRFIANFICYMVYLCCFYGFVFFLGQYDYSVSTMLNDFISSSVDWSTKIKVLLQIFTLIALSLHFCVMHFYVFRFDATFGAFVKSRRRFKQFMIDNDHLSAKVAFYRLPFVKFGSMRNPFFRSIAYMSAVFAYERYRQFLITNPEDPELAKENYMNSKKAISIEDNNPIVNRLILNENFAQYISWPYVIFANILFYLLMFVIALTCLYFVFLII